MSVNSIFNSFVSTFLVFILLSCISNRSSSLPVTSKLSPKYPVVLVPGDGGSQFEARLDKPKTIHYICDKKSDWYSLWLNLELMTPATLSCFIDNFKLQYDRVSRTSRNQPGVETRQPDFGNTSSVEWLDSSKLGFTSYFFHIVEYLVNNMSYVRGVNIRGAPYDFRKSPNEMGDYFIALTHLIEDTYKLNGNQRVVLIGHSMGNLYALYLLQQRTDSWKEKYIRSFVSLAAPWGGAVKPIRLMSSGDNLGVIVVNALTARGMQRTMTSTAWLMPYDTFWNKDEILVYGPHANYTVNDYAKFFEHINYTDGYLMRKDTELLLDVSKPPGVEVHCLHGSNMSTPAAFRFSPKQWYDHQPDVIYGDGDGTVNQRSLLGCVQWQGKQKASVIHQQYHQVEHLGILKNDDINKYLGAILKS